MDLQIDEAVRECVIFYDEIINLIGFLNNGSEHLTGAPAHPSSTCRRAPVLDRFTFEGCVDFAAAFDRCFFNRCDHMRSNLFSLMDG